MGNKKELFLFGISELITNTLNTIIYFVLLVSTFLGSFISNCIAGLASASLAYIFSRFVVFESNSENVAREATTFMIVRISLGLLDIVLMGVLVDLHLMVPLASKILVNIFIIYLNYLASKKYVF
ncbi:MAG: GtrA family protein [Thomasclavelia sp.]|jgi:putative flippase GtrA|nr:GtrA family protein [Thomasclavelia sp.]